MVDFGAKTSTILVTWLCFSNHIYIPERFIRRVNPDTNLVKFKFFIQQRHFKTFCKTYVLQFQSRLRLLTDHLRKINFTASEDMNVTLSRIKK